jgi:hypothetical protein
MKKWLRHLTGVMVAAGTLVAAPDVGAESCKLELKRIEMPSRDGRVVRASPTDYIYRTIASQGFHMQLIQAGQYRPQGESSSVFTRIVKKEPAEYAADHPFRGVANLGSQQYAFVLDAKAPEKAPESDSADEKPEAKDRGRSSARSRVQGLGRLYFDLNHNGDLTDDGVIEAEHERSTSSGTYLYSNFPRVDVSIEADGTTMDYAFTFSVRVRVADDYSYASASLNAAAYREGTIALDGKERRVVLIDFNSNGRFDDEFEIREGWITPNRQVYPQYGDMVLIDPDVDASGYRSPYDPTTTDARHFMSKLIHVDGRYYDLDVSAAGDELTLTPSSLPLGHVTNSNDGFRAAVYGEKGFLKISGDGGKPVALPEGEWRLLSYTIDQTGYEERPAEEKEAEKEQPSLLETLAGALAALSKAAPRSISRPRYTLIMGRATRDYPAVEVREGETAALPFGPPYKPTVKAAGSSRSGAVSLGMSLVGSGGEVCSNLIVDGGRPKAPQFTITTPDGDEVAHGKFEYG